MKSPHLDSVPVWLVIGFVGFIGVMSLAIASWLFWLGKSGEGVLAITNGCVMGLLGLLARTDTRGRQGDPPTGTPANPMTVATTPDKPLETVPASPNDAPDTDAPLSPNTDDDTDAANAQREAVLAQEAVNAPAIAATSAQEVPGAVN